MKTLYFIATLGDVHDTTQGLAELEKQYIEHIHEICRYNQSRTARMLGVSRGTLRKKLKHYFGDKYL